MFPSTIILDCTDELSQFKSSLLSGLDTPSLVDFDNTVAEIFDAVMSLERFDHELTLTAHHISENVDVLFECEEFTTDGAECVYAAVKRMGNAIKNKLLQHNAYRDGQLPYIFRNFIDANSVVLSQIPPVGHFAESTF